MKKWVFGFSAIIVALFAVTTNTAEAKPEKGKVFGDWGIECEASTDKKAEQCFVSQTQTMKEKKGRLLKVSVGYIGANGKPAMVAMLPLGIDLVAGSAFKIDDSKTQTKLTVKMCTMEGCAASVQLSDAQVKEMQNGKKMIIGIVPHNGKKTVALSVPLNGFKQAFSTLK